MDKKTVYVIGAGASKEVNLPVADELKREISSLLDIRFKDFRQVSGDHLLTAALHELVKEPNSPRGSITPYVESAWHIRDAMPQAISIDNFIDTQRDNEKITMCAKLAIVRAILSAERKSLLYFDRFKRSSIDFGYLEETWYLPFFKLLTENCTSIDLNDRLQSIVLIIFNYDRCVEHFIYHALQNYYRLRNDEAVQLVSNMNIYHPYGSVSSLPWLRSNGVIESDAIEFGAEDINVEQLLQLSRKIKTFAEGTDPASSNISAIKEHMKQARRLVFLGFAFHELNMKLITPNQTPQPFQRNCYATAYGISRRDQAVIEKRISRLYPQHVIHTDMEPVECAKFFSEFWRSLAF